METFYRTHSYLVEHTNAPVRRDLMDEIDWNDRLIGITSSNACARCPQSRLKPLATCLLLCAQTVLFAPQYYFPKASVSPLHKLYA